MAQETLAAVIAAVGDARASDAAVLGAARRLQAHLNGEGLTITDLIPGAILRRRVKGAAQAAQTATPTKKRKVHNTTKPEILQAILEYIEGDRYTYEQIGQKIEARFGKKMSKDAVYAALKRHGHL